MLLLALGVADGAWAQQHGHGVGAAHAGPSHQHFDARFSHNHYYFDRGHIVGDAPRGGLAVDHGGDHYWYHGGHWYRRGGAGWVVVGPPFGLFVPLLPPFYTTVWFAGVPYYYANDTYYLWDGDQQQYQVVEPPTGIDPGGTTEPPPSDTLFVYPRNGQTSDQQSRDRYECHHWAVEQTGYDPTQERGGVSPAAAAGKRAEYFRAAVACLDARGYTVK
jgi:hypothetical protein